MTLQILFLAAALAAPLAAQAQAAGSDHAAHHTSATAAGAQSPQAATEGEVRRIDKAQGKITLRHGRIENLDMPPMTMVFTVAEPQLLENLKAGDKVLFTVEKRNGALVVTSLQPAP